jgi:hypothetical protein
MHDPDREIHIERDDVRAGSNEGVVRWVLFISLGLAIIALTIIWVTGALNEGPVESEGTTTGRIQAEADQRNEGGAESDMGVMSPDTIDDTIDAGPIDEATGD